MKTPEKKNQVGFTIGLLVGAAAGTIGLILSQEPLSDTVKHTKSKLKSALTNLKKQYPDEISQLEDLVAKGTQTLTQEFSKFDKEDKAPKTPKSSKRQFTRQS